MEQCRSAPCVVRMVVDGKAELISDVDVDDIVIGGSDAACRDFHAALDMKIPTNNLGDLTSYAHAALDMKIPTNNLGDLTSYAGCALNRNRELGTLEATQTAFVERMLNRFGVNSFSDTPAAPGVELGLREEGEPKGDWPYPGGPWGI